MRKAKEKNIYQTDTNCKLPRNPQLSIKSLMLAAKMSPILLRKDQVQPAAVSYFENGALAAAFVGTDQSDIWDSQSKSHLQLVRRFLNLAKRVIQHSRK